MVFAAGKAQTTDEAGLNRASDTAETSVWRGYEGNIK